MGRFLCRCVLRRRVLRRRVLLRCLRGWRAWVRHLALPRGRLLPLVISSREPPQRRRHGPCWPQGVLRQEGRRLAVRLRGLRQRQLALELVVQDRWAPGRALRRAARNPWRDRLGFWRICRWAERRGWRRSDGWWWPCFGVSFSFVAPAFLPVRSWWPRYRLPPGPRVPQRRSLFRHAGCCGRHRAPARVPVLLKSERVAYVAVAGSGIGARVGGSRSIRVLGASRGASPPSK